MKFPKGFTWGVATSSYQIEGAVHEDGRGASIWDTFSHTTGKVSMSENGDVACDHYHRWQDDLDLIQSLNVNAYRFSIAWPRVQPDGQGQFNDKGLAFYDRLIDGLLERNIAPHVTLYHWDLPQALEDKGGWVNRDTASRFADYSVQVAETLGSRVQNIITHNEPWCASILGYEKGIHAPGYKSRSQGVAAAHHLLLSHGLAMQAMRAAGTTAQLGIVLNQASASTATDAAADVAIAEREYALLVRWFIEPLLLKTYPNVTGEEIHLNAVIKEGDFDCIAQPLDFLGINYYSRIWASSEGTPAPLPKTDMGWEIYPPGLTELLTGLKKDYANLPSIYIYENGMANNDVLIDGRVADAARVDYTQAHIAALKAAMDAGVDVAGYFYWSLMDNFEWAEGYAKRFGLVHVDYTTQIRTLKDSAKWYREFIAEQRGL